MEQVRAVFFDAGGTLIYIDRHFLIERLARHGIRVDERTFVAADRVAGAHAVSLMKSGVATNDATRWRAYGERLLRELGCGRLAMIDLARAVRTRHGEGRLWTHVEPGTAELLAGLRARGYKLVVVSNADGRVADFLRIGGLADHFDAIVDSGAVGVEKPDPGIFRIACEHAGVAPHEAVHVGDIYEIDVLGARAAGVHPILFDEYDGVYDDSCTRIVRLDELNALLPGPAAALRGSATG
jgi:putative hydrolase of the HAD superfamily